MLQEQLREIIKQEKLSHAYLFEGQNRSDLKSMVMDFAAQILCDSEMCMTRVHSGNYADFMLIETDEQTIKKEVIEDCLHRMNQKPIEGQFKVYIIMDFDKVTPQGENSILKFLEEPPVNTIALLATTAPGSILPTIHSRCQHIMMPSKQNDLAMELSDSDIPASLLSTMAHLSFGREEAMHWYEEESFGEIHAAVIKWCQTIVNDGTMALIQISELLSVLDKREKQLVAIDMVQLYFQDELYVLLGESAVSSYPDQLEQFKKISMKINVNQCVNMIEHTLSAKQKLLQYVNVTLVFEQLAIRMQNEVN